MGGCDSPSSRPGTHPALYPGGDHPSQQLPFPATTPARAVTLTTFPFMLASPSEAVTTYYIIPPTENSRAVFPTSSDRMDLAAVCQRSPLVNMHPPLTNHPPPTATAAHNQRQTPTSNLLSCPPPPPKYPRLLPPIRVRMEGASCAALTTYLQKPCRVTSPTA